MEEINVWKDGIIWVREIYKLTRNDKFSRDFGLCDQIRRSAVSIPSNIAEGYERNSRAEFIRYLKIAKASCAESRTQLYLAHDIGYISQKDYDRLADFGVRLSAMIMKLINSLK